MTTRDASRAVAEDLRARLASRQETLAAADKLADRLGNLRLAMVALALVLVLLPLATHDAWPW